MSIGLKAAAARHNCSTKTILRRVASGDLIGRKERITSPNGHVGVCWMFDFTDLDKAFDSRPTVEERNRAVIDQIVAAKPRFTEDDLRYLASLSLGVDAV